MLDQFYDADHELWRESVRAFVTKHLLDHLKRWEDTGAVDPDVWLEAAAQGLLAISLPEAFGGGGESDYRFRMVIMEELAAVGAASVNDGFSSLDDLSGPYLVDLGTAEQHARWLPGLCSGRHSTALALSEPGAGSDLRAISTSAVPGAGGWVLSGGKTFISNGDHAQLAIVFARTPGQEHGDYSLFVVEKGTPGFSAGQPIETMGRKAKGLTELYFDDVVVPKENLLGRPGAGFAHLGERLPRERMSIACYAMAAAQAALRWTLEFTKSRTAFGAPLAHLQTMKFALAEMSTEIDVSRAYLDAAILSLNAGQLTAVEAAKAKWWMSEMVQRILTRCVQMHGGYGYTMEYPIARAFVDARIQTIYGGTTEIMKEIIGRSMVR